MKKLKAIITFVVLCFLVGCAKVDTTLDISKDGKVKVSFIEAVDKEFFNDKNVKLDRARKNKLKDNGFEIENYENDDMKGYKFSKTFSSINLLTVDKEDEINYSFDLNAFLDNNTNFFVLKKGFFKNIYVAKFSSSVKDSIYDELKSAGVEEYLKFDNDEVDLSFSVNLPGKAIYSNATKTFNGGTSLYWDLNDFDSGYISFKFTLLNMTNIILTISSILVIIILVLIIIFKIKNRKNNPETVIEENMILDEGFQNDSVVSYDNSLQVPQEATSNYEIENNLQDELIDNSINVSSEDNDSNSINFEYPEMINNNDIENNEE